MHECLRVYPSGHRVPTQRDDEGVVVWSEYNEQFRPGCALFIDGKCIATGALSAERIAVIEAELTGEKPTTQTLT